MPVKDPAEVLDYSVDWDRSSETASAGTGWLASGETITASTWTVPTGITQTTPAPSVVAGKTTIWLTGGTTGTRYTITNHITTSQGRQGERSMLIQVRDR
jgi:hypothetical protein